MGILIQFPQPGTRTPPVEPSSSHCEPQDARLTAAYRRDLDRALSLLLEHVETDAYDGVALILKPKSLGDKPAFVVGGFYRHRLTEAADAAMQLRLAIKLRAREQSSEPETRLRRNSPPSPSAQPERAIDQSMQTSLHEKWNNATARYHRCEQMLRLAFSKQLRASPETTAILLSITQLHIETVANCLWELVRQPGRATPQGKLETLNAIQLFRNVRAQVSAWMPPAGQEAAYFAANACALSEEMIGEGDSQLCEVENALKRIVGNTSTASVGT
ncbi:hypothetical protein KOL96_13765 [Ralstonia wenshanensis]|uniref:hypothetical protein n=1 Tax=Ralstonia wenshanensis TaxID=2842456 RepID=UPI001E2FEDA4|nr:hypothetical protein [Ralstonia wenshanensis]UGS92137.1 hypothetical protein KOL96_13765 [Ralstonia wenshanensis]